MSRLICVGAWFLIIGYLLVSPVAALQQEDEKSASQAATAESDESAVGQDDPAPKPPLEILSPKNKPAARRTVCGPTWVAPTTP